MANSAWESSHTLSFTAALAIHTQRRRNDFLIGGGGGGAQYVINYFVVQNIYGTD